MKSLKSQEPPRQYEKRKLIIENLEISMQKELFESELTSFLSKYGAIVDLVIMINSYLKRKTEVLCLSIL